MVSRRVKVRIISDWWNNIMRKDWREALARPGERNKRLLELAAMLHGNQHNSDKEAK